MNQGYTKCIHEKGVIECARIIAELEELLFFDKPNKGLDLK